jgi:hypothetical protein
MSEPVSPLLAIALLAVFGAALLWAAIYYPRIGRSIISTGVWPSGHFLWAIPVPDMPCPRVWGYHFVFIGWWIRILSPVALCTVIGAVVLKLAGLGSQ